MTRTPRVHGTAWLMVLLTGIAGWVDAVAYVRLGAVFVANQTGNAVFLAVQIAERVLPGTAQESVTPGDDTYGPLASLVGFCLGVAASVIPLRRARLSGEDAAPWLLLAIEAVLLAAVVLLAGAPRELRLGLAAAAMGLQSVYAAGVAMRGVTTTTLTGTLVALISTFADDPGRKARRAIVLLTAVWAAYTIGAWGGAAAGLTWSIGTVHGIAALAAGAAAFGVWRESARRGA
ncbi:YoaK family protein [Catenulispora yoronensis]|uniref:YoaK family protein n=1 Tax=Catenulispora yoronensis TaxID=450799 RepID=UPI0031D19AD7